MKCINFICSYLFYIQIKPPETFNLNKTDGTLSFFKEEIEKNWRNERNFINFHCGPNPIEIYHSRFNLKNKRIK